MWQAFVVPKKLLNRDRFAVCHAKALECANCRFGLVAGSLMAVTYASVLLQRQSEALGLPRICDVESRAAIPQAVTEWRTPAATYRQQGSTLFWFQSAQYCEQKLEYRIVF